MTTPAKLPPFIRLVPQYRERVWGGTRLKPDSPVPIGELWAVHEDNAVIGMPGETLGTLTRKFPEEMLGPNRSSDRFPLLIKLLDCNDWLSVQVHPNDAQAIALEGPGHVGKTEAWHVLDAAPGAELIAGVRQGVTDADLSHEIVNGNVLDVLQRHVVQKGATFYVPAGTVHALGPGLLLYEIQQASDITYRIWDWNRPTSAGRDLHLAKGALVARASWSSRPDDVANFFAFDMFETKGVHVLGGDCGTRILTSLSGELQIGSDNNLVSVRPYESIVIPAVIREIELNGDAMIVRARVQ